MQFENKQLTIVILRYVNRNKFYQVVTCSLYYKVHFCTIFFKKEKYLIDVDGKKLFASK